MAVPCYEKQRLWPCRAGVFPCRGTPLRGQATCRLNSPLHRQRAGKGEAGVSWRMRHACETMFACKRTCAPQGCNRPCRMRTGLQASTATQADRMRSETPATPCSALTQLVNAIERKKVNVHAAFQAKVSGQLPNLGSSVAPQDFATRTIMPDTSDLATLGNIL